MAQPSWLTKFVIVGDPSVGKSSLLVRLTDDRFLTNPETTIGVEFGSHVVEIEETGERIKCQCWDTAGSETFRSVSRRVFT
jgi:Ras-related protein Rab-2A